MLVMWDYIRGIYLADPRGLGVRRRYAATRTLRFLVRIPQVAFM
jgi:hypothetical protein